MKAFTRTMLAALLAAAVLAPVARAQIASRADAERAAGNWLRTIVHHRGDWGGAPDPRMAEVTPLERDGRLLGYHCRVAPRGYIIVSPIKQIAAVRDFGWEGDLVLDETGGMADFLRDHMARRLDVIEARLGPVARLSAAELESALGSRHRAGWDLLTRDAARFRAELAGGAIGRDYQAGEELIETRWHQYPPYNNYCPEVPPGNPCELERCLVGCTATAAVEIFRYWGWPPRGMPPYDDPYDWANMPVRLTGSSSAQEIGAVAELCAEAGAAMPMYYCVSEDGCGSFAPFAHAKQAMDDYFFYALDSDSLMRNDYPDDDVWFAFIKEQHNLNRPIEYGIEGHAVVMDGWMEVTYPLPEKWVHVCPGFGGGDTDWYLLDAILWSDGENELMIRDIYPQPVVDNPLQGNYSSAAQLHGHWYVDRDNTGADVNFMSGCQVQFLHGIVVTGTAPPGGDPILFRGGTAVPTRLFTRGDPTRGARLLIGGRLALHGGGSIVLY
ncbi:MAG: C10 family peptidase [Candidatus Krumholzibacteriota bacterium]|nr:C10 family peptidase [Candidatus Krumholzibacteriota bacterium]